MSAANPTSDKRLTVLVLADMAFASHASIVEQADVSGPTVTLFCRALGCDGIREFKFRLAQALAIGSACLLGGNTSRGSPRSSPDVICDGVLGAVERLRVNLDREPSVAAAPHLASARVVLA